MGQKSITSYSSLILIGLPFVVVMALIGLLNYLDSGSLEALGRVPNMAAALYVSLLAGGAMLWLRGVAGQKRHGKIMVITLAIIGGVCWALFAAWLFNGIVL